MADAMRASAVRQQSGLVGHIDGVESGEVVGWAYNEHYPDAPLQVSLRVDEITLGAGTADILRSDLKAAGYGSGCHGFRIKIDVPFHSGQKLELQLFDEASGAAMAAMPFSLHCRHPKALMTQELDPQGVHGLEPVKPGRRKKKLRSVLSPVFKPIFKPIKKIRKRYRKPQEVSVAQGTLAKLARMDCLSVNSTANAEHWPVLSLPVFNEADYARHRVSVVIPVHNQFHLTYQCLSSLVLSADSANIEFIVVDDASTDITAVIESRVRNLRVVRNNSNLGFLHSCNNAAEQVQGDFIVFLNNDTEVEAGWIDRMLDVFDNYPQVGAVGAKLIYPDGRLQDAGGIVWESGTPWNVGHGKDRDDPEYNYVREVDYLTGAALMVSRMAWNEVGGFSEQYAPAYYEDTDLAFKLRDAGYRTLYCPQATVVHYEGCSNGTDTASGIKQHQVINAERFKNTWRERFNGLGTEGQDLRRNKDRNRGLRVLMVDNAFPRLGQDAGSYAAIQELTLLLELGCKVTFLPHNLLHLGKHVDCLQRMGVECVHAPFQFSVERFMQLRAAEFDVVYITRYVVAEKIIPMVRRHSEARIIFNNADLHFLRELRGALAAGQTDMSAVQRTRQRELAVMQATDVVLSYSDIELEIVATHLLSRDKLFRCPWVLSAVSQGKSWGHRSGLTFLGGFAHPPNKLAMDWFIQNVMPELHKKRPELTLNIWGSHMPQDCAWNDQAGVKLHGYAESLDDVFHDALMFIAPLQAGAGIKGKVLDSLAYGVPTVLSPVAAEATGLIDGSSTLIAQSPEQWIMHIESLLDSEELWNHVRDNASHLRDQRYSRQAGVAAMQQVFSYLDLDTGVEHQQVISQ